MLLTFKSAAALWRQDRWKPVVAGAVNLALSVTLVILLPEEYKLDGVIFSTIVGFAFIQVPWESHVVFTSFFGKAESRVYWRSYAGFAFCALALCALAWLAVCAVPLGGVLGLAAKGAAAAVVSSGFVIAVFRKDVLAALGKVKNKKVRDA